MSNNEVGARKGPLKKGTNMAQLQRNVQASGRKELPADLAMQRDKDKQPVRGKFIYHELPGGKLEFVYKKYYGEPVQIHRLTDGEVYTIPLGVYKHLNTECAVPAYDFKPDENGRPVTKMVQRIRRCSFQSLEFLDIESELPKNNSISSRTMSDLEKPAI